MKCLLYFLSIFILIAACKPKAAKLRDLEQLKARKVSIDSLITEKSIIILVKTAGANDLIQVKGNKYPPDIETTYNVVKDKDGKIVYMAQLPFSKTSDWFIAYRSYFDEEGKLFAFQRLNNYLHSECTRGAAMEKSTNFYNHSFKLIDSTYTITDSQRKPLEKADCKFPYNFPYKVYKNVKSYKEETGIDE